MSVFGLVLFKKHTTIKAFDFVNRRASTGVNEAYGILEDSKSSKFIDQLEKNESCFSVSQCVSIIMLVTP